MNKKPYIIPSKTNNKNMERYLHKKLSEVGEGGGGGSSDSEAIKYTEQTLTAEQQAQARTNIGATAPEIFLATLGVTTVSEIQNALDSGLFVVVTDNAGRVCPFFRQDANFYWFGGISSNQAAYVYLTKANGTWAAGGAVNLEMTGNKSQSIETDKDSTTKYPSTKAVADALGGKKLWTGSAAEYTQLTPSNDTIYFITP